VFVGAWTFRAYDYLVEQCAEEKRSSGTLKRRAAGAGDCVEIGSEAMPAGSE